MCTTEGRVTPAEVADHDIPHHGDYRLFWFGTLTSLCKACHDSRKRRLERSGFLSEIGVDGWPTDPKHPANLI
jgi:hypothetical protein